MLSSLWIAFTGTPRRVPTGTVIPFENVKGFRTARGEPTIIVKTLWFGEERLPDVK